MYPLHAELLERPQLPFDILRLVCDSLTEIPDVLSFALTCSGLTGNAFRRRLRMSPINLTDDKVFDSFERFIFADVAGRAPHIYGLIFSLPTDDQFGVGDPHFRTLGLNDRLVAILQVAVHLQYINFPISTGFDSVLTAAANMTSLRELQIFLVANSPVKNHLGAFRSPLRILRLQLGDVNLNDEGVMARFLQNHLVNLAPTLEVLHLVTGSFNIRPSLVTTQFTAVRSLTILTLNFNQFTLEILLRLFPGLDSLILFIVHPMPDMEEVFPDWREVNKRVQSTRAWRGMDHVACDAECAFLMALRCPIRRMDTSVSSRQVKQYLAPVLRHNYPQQLHLHVRSFDDGMGDLDELFPSEGAENLTHLVVFIKFNIGYGLDYGRGDREVPWTRFRDKLIASIRHLRRLTHLRLVFHYDVAQRNPPNTERDSMYTASETDLHPAARELTCTMPTLRYVFLTTCGNTSRYVPRNVLRQEVNKWLSSKGWRVVHEHNEEGHLATEPSDPEAKAGCTELGRREAERIMDREELQLLHHEQATLRDCGDAAT
ncbi:hypothetical protein V8D89_007917 [Ganoderma adspersum]